jgi:hypothetical protein
MERSDRDVLRAHSAFSSSAPARIGGIVPHHQRIGLGPPRTPRRLAAQWLSNSHCAKTREKPSPAGKIFSPPADSGPGAAQKARRDKACRRMVGNGGLLPRSIYQSQVALLMKERGKSANFIRRTKQDADAACIPVGLPPKTSRQPVERRSQPLNSRQYMPHGARVFRPLLPLTPGSSPTVLWMNIGPAPSAVKSRKPAACFVSDRLWICGEQCGVGANVRTSSFTPAQMS